MVEVKIVLGTVLCLVGVIQASTLKKVETATDEMYNQIEEMKASKSKDELPTRGTGQESGSPSASLRYRFMTNDTNVKAMGDAKETDHFTQPNSRRKRSLWGKPFDDVKLLRKCIIESQCCGCHAVDSCRFRAADGACGNKADGNAGRTGLPFKRLLPPEYGDGESTPRLAKSGDPLPNARILSNLLFREQDEENGVDMLDDKDTVMVMQWGQFIDHDTDLSPMFTEMDGSTLDCCDPTVSPEKCFSISVDEDDAHFGPSGVDCISVPRSVPAPQCPQPRGPRRQMNKVTSFMDASHVYGSTKAQQDGLRLFQDGMLKTSPAKIPGKDIEYPLLPPGLEFRCTKPIEPYFCHYAGEIRVNTNPGLVVSHTTFHREHQRYARELKKLNPHWGDERLYQEARRIMGAVMQHINYGEYLPIILGNDIMEAFDLLEDPDMPFVDGVYDENVDPTVSNSFAAAAFRFGHSQITNPQNRYFKNCSLETESVLDDHFNLPAYSQTGTNVEGLVRAIYKEKGGKSDRFFSHTIRNQLFKDPDTGRAGDLPAINIQRGRDHGLPGYNKFRRLFHLPEFDRTRINEEGGRANHTVEVATILADGYVADSDIDLYAAGVTEQKLPGAAVGPLFAAMIASEYQRLKVGDYYWFEHERPADRGGFTAEQVLSIKGYTLAKAVCMNHDVDNIQPNVFRQVNTDNVVIACDDIPDLNFALFQETQP